MSNYIFTLRDRCEELKLHRIHDRVGGAVEVGAMASGGVVEVEAKRIIVGAVKST